MSYCDGLISIGLENKACVKPKKGYERRAVIINREDIDFSGLTYSETHKNTVTALPLKTGKKGYLIEQVGQRPFTGTTSEAVIGTYVNSVTHNVVIAIVENDREVNDGFTDSLFSGEFVLVLEKKDKGANNASAFKIIGLDQGAVLSAYTGDAYSDTAGGGLATLTEAEAPSVETYLGDSYAEGKSIFDSLIEAAE